ncbi:hypothetical protein [Polaribacter sp.]|uniref:hypothetical protein n=1 Tax=Polaribacter sp. TaxID=1920175 RepID=UPI00404852DD
MANLPDLKVPKKIKKRQLRIYNKNLDIHPLDSYFDVSKKLIHIEFPVHDKEIKLKGLYFYNLGFMQILAIHICHNKFETISDKEKKFMAVIEDFGEDNLDVQGKINFNELNELHICVINNETWDFDQLLLLPTKGILRPNEAGGGGVIVEGP